MQKKDFNRNWQFSLDEDFFKHRRTEQPKQETVHLPHDWSIGMERSADAPSGVSNGFFPMGRASYEKVLQAPEEWRGKKVMLEFEGVYMNAEVWLNENLVTRHPYGYTNFLVDLTPYLKFGEQNTVKVMVDNAAQTNSRWYSGSGIYRPVWLYAVEPIHVAHWGISVTTPEVSPEKAQVNAAVTVQNETAAAENVTVQVSVFDHSGTLCAQSEARVSVSGGATHRYDFVLAVTDPSLWSPDSPALYRLETVVSTSSGVVDKESTAFGIRTIEVDAQRGFRLNGQPLKLKGGCVHHDNGILGSASFWRSEERKVAVHKASGYNAIRTAHNPPSPSFLDACDRLGMLVMDEAFDCWRQGKNPYDYHVSFDDWWQRDIDSMVLRDRNHPCVVMWSIGNEVLERDGRSGGAEIARNLAERVRALDVTRPVTSAICGVWDKTHTWEDTDVVFAVLDVGGYNYQWKNYRPDHERHPQRVIVGCESTAMEALETWQSVMDLDHVIGDFVWTSLDYLGESGIGRVHFDEDQKKHFSLGEFPWHQANCGDLDLCGFKRPQSYYRDVLWGCGDPLYIAVHTPVAEGKTPVITYWGWPDVVSSWNWPDREGQTIKIDVYSSCEQVELLLNDESLGKKPATAAERFTATFEVPYQPGELRAVGYTNGQKAAEQTLRTTGPAARVKLSPDQQTLFAAQDDLCFVTVEITDEGGNRHPTADRPVYFTIKGPGVIQAVGSADPTSTERYQGNFRSTFQGRCLVVIRANGEPGDITLRAQADGIDGDEITISAG